LPFLEFGLRLGEGNERSKKDGDTSVVKPSPQEIREAIIRATPIPRITLIKLIRTLHEGNYDLAEVAELIIQDQVLSAQVLSYC